MERVQWIATEEALERAFERKLASFVEDYDLAAKPALIWQAWPATLLEIDILSEKVRDTLRQGGGPNANDGWWNGFKMGWSPMLVFDGLSSKGKHGSAGWATEVHTDCHVIAGVWTFPEVANGTAAPQLGVADFFAEAFRDFAYLAGQIFEVADAPSQIHIGATMRLADQLAFVGGPGRVLAPASNRKILRWPIATIGAVDLPRAGATMAAQFMRSYGRRAPAP